MSDTTTDVEVRRMTDDDLTEVLGVLQASLGWVPDGTYEAFFRWKHHDNPFGRSPGWVAVDDGAVVGVRLWLRWELVRGGTTWQMVRAVDTATHPDHQGRGIFRRLTTTSLDELRADGVDFVFNTPNEQSRPGYLKMGWREVGRLPVAVRVTGPAALGRTARARVAADKWSEPTAAGVPAPEALADDRLEGLLAADGERRAGDERIRTPLTPTLLRWRYGFPALHYRATWTSDGDGLAVWRVRRRGPARECVVCVVVARDDRGRTRALRDVGRAVDADHLIEMTTSPSVAAGFWRVPRLGPILTWRPVNAEHHPGIGELDLGMGDVELF